MGKRVSERGQREQVQSQAKPDYQRDQTRGFLSILIIRLNSHGCGRSHIDLQIHAPERQREGEEEAH